MPGINDIAAKVAEKIGVKKDDAKEAVVAVLESIKECSLEGTVSCHPLGVFKIKERADREGRNPSNGEKIMIEGGEVLTFKPSDKRVERPKAKKSDKKKAAPVAEEKKSSKSKKEEKPAKKGRRR